MKLKFLLRLWARSLAFVALVTVGWCVWATIRFVLRQLIRIGRAL